MFGSAFKEWLSKPFSEDMPATHWFMLIGLLIVCVLAWRFILRHLVIAVSAAAN